MYKNNYILLLLFFIIINFNNIFCIKLNNNNNDMCNRGFNLERGKDYDNKDILICKKFENNEYYIVTTNISKINCNDYGLKYNSENNGCLMKPTLNPKNINCNYRQMIPFKIEIYGIEFMICESTERDSKGRYYKQNSFGCHNGMIRKGGMNRFYRYLFDSSDGACTIQINLNTCFEPCPTGLQYYPRKGQLPECILYNV